jgi:hypothetical protein
MGISDMSVRKAEERNRPFAESRRLLIEYTELQQSRNPTFRVHLLAEARMRLDQLDYVLNRIREIEAPPIALDEKFDRHTVLFTYVDAFYHVVTRLKMLFHKNKDLGLNAFEPKTTLAIRSRIQHPEQDGPDVLSWSFGHPDGSGPTYNSDDQRDQGLYRNVEEVRSALERTIGEAIARFSTQRLGGPTTR